MHCTRADGNILLLLLLIILLILILPGQRRNATKTVMLAKNTMKLLAVQVWHIKKTKSSSLLADTHRASILLHVGVAAGNLIVPSTAAHIPRHILLYAYAPILLYAYSNIRPFAPKPSLPTGQQAPGCQRPLHAIPTPSYDTLIVFN